MHEVIYRELLIATRWWTNEIVSLTGRAIGTDGPPSAVCIWTKEVRESS